MATPPDNNRLGRAYAAPKVTVFYDRGRCRHYAECVRGLPQVFDPTRRPWIRADLADAQAVAEVVRRCPTDALHYRLPAEEAEEPTHPTSIAPDPRGGHCWSSAEVRRGSCGGCQRAGAVGGEAVEEIVKVLGGAGPVDGRAARWGRAGLWGQPGRPAAVPAVGALAPRAGRT
jgi:uncharacterized Fe-S cluster protein YjdI